jgi:hypothetical protein
MANSLTVQTLEEGPRNVRVRVVGVLDTSNLAVQDLLDPANYNQGGTGPTPSTFRVDEIEYSVAPALAVQLVWDATADVVFAALTGPGEMCFQDEGGLQNNAGAGKTGKIQILTTGWTAGTQVFTLELALVKIGSNL